MEKNEMIAKIMQKDKDAIKRCDQLHEKQKEIKDSLGITKLEDELVELKAKLKSRKEFDEYSMGHRTTFDRIWLYYKFKDNYFDTTVKKLEEKQKQIKEEIEILKTPELKDIDRELSAINVVIEVRNGLYYYINGSTDTFELMYLIMHENTFRIMSKIKEPDMKEKYMKLYFSFEEWELQLMKDFWNSRKRENNKRDSQKIVKGH